MSFMSFTKSQFERELILIRSYNYLKSWSNFTDEYNSENEGYDSWEEIYKFPTKVDGVDIVIFSSIEKRTGRSRSIGSDAVRVVYRLETEDEIIYKKIKKHNRVTSLFDNLEDTITKAYKDAHKA